MNIISGLVTKAYAAQITPPPTNISSIGELVSRIIPIVYGVAGIGLFALFVYGGFTWLMSAGDPEKVRKATDTMVNAAIGIAIVIFAYYMTRVVGGILGFQLIY